MNPHDSNLTSDYYNAHWNSFASRHYPQAKVIQAERFLSPVINKLSIRTIKYWMWDAGMAFIGIT